MLQKSSFVKLLVSILMLWINITYVSAQDPLEGWGFSKQVQVQDKSQDQNNRQYQGKSQYRSVYLDEGVYAKARSDLVDIRIVDAEGDFVPYYIDSGYAENAAKDTDYSAKLISTIQKDNDTLIDFQIIPLHENTDIQVNLLKVTLPPQAFLKYVEVSGSHDGNQWEVVEKSTLYNTEKLEKSSIELSKLYKFSYYRLRIIDNVEKVAFTQLKLHHNEQESRWKAYTKNVTPGYAQVHENRQTKITVQNDQRLKVKKLILNVEGNFRRTYDLLDINGKTIPIGSLKELYNLNFKDIQIRETSIRLTSPIALEQMVIRINNEDNAPLHIRGISFEYDIDKLVFEDKGSKDYRLVYGNPNAVKPKYEMVGFKTHIEKENPPLATLGAELGLKSQAPVTIEKQPSWFQTKWFFNVVIGLISLMLIVYLMQKLNRGKK